MSALTIGLLYETFETYRLRATDPVDAHAEFEPESTIEALESAIRSLGHHPRRLGSPAALLERLGRAGPGFEVSRGVLFGESLGVDVVFNLAEGRRGRNREAWGPVLLEMAGVPTLGSDALTLSLSLDKAWANRWVRAAGIPVAEQRIFTNPREAESAALPAEFPLFVKPRWEGSAIGIQASSRVESRAALIAEVHRITSNYAQPALVEAFVPGAEYTVTLIGNRPVRALPVIQRAVEITTRIGLHALEGAAGSNGNDGTLEYEASGDLDADLEERLGLLACRAFEVFECRDFARVDFRLDAKDQPVFLEINPLPTFATDGSFSILAELEGVPLSVMLGRCISAGLERLGWPQAAAL